MYSPRKELTYAESLGHRIVLHFSDTRDGTEINESMNAFLAKLPKQLFVRCHRGFVVNIRYVRKIKAESLSLASGTEIPVGRKYMKELRLRFDHYYQGDIRIDQYL